MNFICNRQRNENCVLRRRRPAWFLFLMNCATNGEQLAPRMKYVFIKTFLPVRWVNDYFSIKTEVSFGLLSVILPEEASLI